MNNNDSLDYFGQSIKDALMIIVWTTFGTLLVVGTIISIALGVLK